MANETFTPHTPVGTDYDSAEWQAEFTRRAEYHMRAISRLADALEKGVLTNDDAAINTDADILAETLCDLEDNLSLCEPGLAASISLIAHDLLWCGYALGRRGKAHPEISAMLSSRHASIAGAARGAARRKKADETWRPHALDLAIESRKVDPSLSQDGVVYYIVDHWRLETDPPGHRWLKDFVGGWIKSGKLSDKIRKRARSVS